MSLREIFGRAVPDEETLFPASSNPGKLENVGEAD
jgi:hypothetical protein